MLMHDGPAGQATRTARRASPGRVRQRREQRLDRLDETLSELQRKEK
jgi:hypothetical protein